MTTSITLILTHFLRILLPWSHKKHSDGDVWHRHAHSCTQAGRAIESLRLEKTTKDHQAQPTPPCPSPHPSVPHVQHSGTPPGTVTTTSLGSPVPLHHHSLGEKPFPNTQPKPSLAQIEATTSHPITVTLERRLTPNLVTTCFHRAVEISEVSSEPPLLQTEPSHLPQLLSISHYLHLVTALPWLLITCNFSDLRKPICIRQQQETFSSLLDRKEMMAII